jgi:DNA transposition AAA+ family ATPase
MSSTAHTAEMIVTKEHRRFTEFCDACRHYRYIGLCYGAPGVGKTLSARHYANWPKVDAYWPFVWTAPALLHEIMGNTTVFYTPKVVNAPGHILRDIQALRARLRALSWEAQRSQTAVAPQHPSSTDDRWGEPSLQQIFTRTAFMQEQLVQAYLQNCLETADPTRLLIIDETDRLKPAGLEQVRDIFDVGDVGVVLLGMPGLEKRLARYPQLYSRVGFVHAFRPLSAEEVHALLGQRWHPPGVALPEEGWTDDTVRAAIIRITGGNFRLFHRLLTQIARVVEINALTQVTREVVETARESLVIGTA